MQDIYSARIWWIFSSAWDVRYFQPVVFCLFKYIKYIQIYPSVKKVIWWIFSSVSDVRYFQSVVCQTEMRRLSAVWLHQTSFPSQPFFPWYWHLLFGEGGRSIKFGFVKICSLARVVGPSNLTSSNGRLFQLQSFPASMILTSGVTHSSRHIHPPPSHEACGVLQTYIAFNIFHFCQHTQATQC